MEYIILDLKTATEEQLKATIECNCRTARLMRSEIDKLKSVAEAAKKVKKPVITSDNAEALQEPNPLVDEDFENEVEYYLSQLRELSSENIETEFPMSLPSPKHYQYERILNRLKLESLKTIKEIKDLLAEEGALLDDISLFQDEYSLELQKIELIDKLLKPEKEDVEQTTQDKNRLVYVPTSGGDIRVLEELDGIPSEYYERFKGLFESIQDGTFKNVKRFTNHNELIGLCEVKDFQVRVLFVRLDQNAYAVISAFVKKTDTDKAYRSSIIKKYADYQSIESALRQNLNNEEFMDLQQEYEQELSRKLSNGKSAPVVKKKAGDVK